MQDTERDSVFLGVRPAGLVPLDMGRFQSNKCMSHPNIESTHCTLMLIGANDPVAEIRIPFPLFRCFEFQIQTNGLKYILVN